jgi:hypothetical protein
MSNLHAPPDRNELARQCADLRDQLTTLGAEYAAAQERFVVQLAALELDAGKTVDEVSDRAYDDKDLVLQHLMDRVWTEGYLEGLRAAESQVQKHRVLVQEEGL